MSGADGVKWGKLGWVPNYFALPEREQDCPATTACASVAEENWRVVGITVYWAGGSASVRYERRCPLCWSYQLRERAATPIQALMLWDAR